MSGKLWVSSERCAIAVGILLLSFFDNPVFGSTNPQDASALRAMHAGLNSAPQLTGWSSSGGHPCDDSWKGIKCSHSSVTEIRLSSLGLTGSMGYKLSSLTSVTYFDLSNNNLQGPIRYQLPPNAEHVNLGGNSFSGSIPYSISQMGDLKYLNLAHNQLNGQLNDMFGPLKKLASLNLAFNSLSGDLPQSFASLSSLTTLNLENNQFTGTINVLADLPLDDLNIGNNQFHGWIPNELKDIKNLKTNGNSWSSGPAPVPPSSNQKNKHNSGGHSESEDDSKKTFFLLLAFGLIGGALILLGIMVVIIIYSRKRSTRYLDDEKMTCKHNIPLVSQEFKDPTTVESCSSIQMRTFQTSPSMGCKHPPSERHKSNDSALLSKVNSRGSTSSVPTTKYSLAELQMAAGNFGRDHLVGQGTLGRVFKAKYVDGKVFASKKLEMPSFQGDNSEEFMDLVSQICHLHHPNITKLVGYCSERGQNILVYEFLRNGSLHEYLHLSDNFSNPLTWNTRVKIALGTARAIDIGICGYHPSRDESIVYLVVPEDLNDEHLSSLKLFLRKLMYLHEVCSPSVIHKNIKSANILLDTELNPHLSDCGFTSFYQDLNENLGAGYIAPECTTLEAYTIKSDVYSFGVVMLEVLTGRMPFDSSRPRSEQSLVRWASPQLHDFDALANMVDPSLRGLYPAKSLSRLADVIALCVQPEPEFRPPMSEVIQALLRLIQRTSMNKRTSGDESGA